MPHRPSLARSIALAAAALIPALLSAQSDPIPLTAAEWQATDSIRFEKHLGVPAVYINSGVALSRSARLRNGVIEFDIAATEKSTNMGISFRATDAENAEVVFFRPGASGRDEAMQYAPSINSIPAAWQLFHGPGALANVTVPRNQWIHVRLRVFGDSAAVYLRGDTAAALVIPRLAANPGGDKIGLWGSGFGRGRVVREYVVYAGRAQLRACRAAQRRPVRSTGGRSRKHSMHRRSFRAPCRPPPRSSGIRCAPIPTAW